MTRTINITATAHYNPGDSTVIRAKVTHETPYQIHFAVGKRAIAAAQRRVGLILGDYLDYEYCGTKLDRDSFFAVMRNGELVGSIDTLMRLE